MSLVRTAFYIAVGFAAGFFYRQYQAEDKNPLEAIRPSSSASEPEVMAEKREEVIAVEETPPAVTRDDLTKIKGIGPVFAKRFYEAGVNGFADLAALTAEEAREISGLKEWQPADPADWITQAAELS